MSNAVHVMRIATGEIEESVTTEDGKSKAERVRIAKKAALIRWRNKP